MVKLKRMVALYNMIPNLAWSILNLTPISIFCYSFMNLKLFYCFLGVSILPVFLPKSFFDNIKIAKTVAFYKRAGVVYINRFTQNGDVINALIRKRFPQYKVVSGTRRSITKVVQQTYMFEKFHFVMFLLFILIAIYAIIYHYLWWAVIITANNIVYNVYPCLLQQYIRTRLRAF